MPNRYYVDSSAYLCILLGERGHEKLVREIEGSEIVSSVLLALEVERNLVRLARAGLLPIPDLGRAMSRLETDLEQFTLRDLTLDLCRSGAMPLVSTPRSLDLVHLRTALWFHGTQPLTRFVSLDVDQTQAATELRLPV